MDLNEKRVTSFTYIHVKSLSNKFEFLEEFIKIAFLNLKNILDSTFAYLQMYYIIPKGVAPMK
ncbi:MAG: hypothetical protein H8D22_10280 [Candidatus Cloacimonetes bacterium]|nr:hypothetical protein [Candidatus Cloacimonadota bacterium]